ncbi:T9SS type A sorting domain-containing protein [Chitinophagaceae bacterium LB-8]|uniref:T9SS type A sorting domain-containing protein n=1 Tax=Paraflavisolibacter caeni TaxID=2982496 RepID=A0A9X2XWH3_9BACT|nr:T9SS type A sorting domain-containing protein [Paraflavisolibacter caeni]MCU7549961.1 T9SS type A sorting domain-containing protein [Paraflavisolibacter caeni]
MKKLTHISFLFFMLSLLVIDIKAQDCSNCGNGCTSEIVNTKKISFSKKAPAPWAIDGRISDWEEILGSRSEDDVLKPFELPSGTAFNWALDADNEEELTTECSSDFSSHIFDDPFPKPDQNIRLTAFTHDDFNVFFYFRRLAHSNSINSFYYFCDVNADGYMNEGEPVFHAALKENNSLSLTLSRYLPDIHRNFIKGKGNPLAIVQEDSNGIRSGGPIVQNYPMPGRLEKVFDSKNVPHKERLKKNETFAAAFTEDGYGVELAVPWQYLKLWIVDHKKKKQIEKLEDELENLSNNQQWLNSWLDPFVDQLEDIFVDRWKKTKSLKAGEIFFYKLSLKRGGGKYTDNDVADNVGNPCDGVGKSGDVAFDTSISTPVFIPDSGYRFKLSYTNRTNATETFDITGIVFNEIKFDHELPPNDEEEDISIKIYSDRNCNGIPEQNDSMVTVPLGGSVPSVCSVNTFANIQTETEPNAKACFIIDILPRDHAMIVSGGVNFQPTVNFIPADPCIFCSAGRTIKQIGIMRSSFSSLFLFTNNGLINKAEQHSNPSQVLVYPNPNRGSAMVYLPAKEGAATIVLEDYSGRNLQQWKNYASTNLQINNLRPGFYLLRVYYPGKVETKKIVVQ